MSTKNLFDKGKSYKTLSSVDPATLGLDAESYRNIQAQSVDKDRFIPNVDFSSASNFVVYGSAKKYYESAFDRIRDEFPYDGSSAEKQEFFNSSSYLDLYIYDQEYPKSTGYAIFSADGWGTTVSKTDGWGISADLEYIEFYGGPHTASNGMENKTIHSEFSASNIYDTDIYDTQGVLPLGKQGSRGSNLELDTSKGFSIEFWMKKDEFITSLTERETIFDLWNGELSSSDSYGRITVHLSGATGGEGPLRINIMSGTTGFQNINVLNGDYTTGSVADGNWHHYGITFVSGSDSVTLNAYIDGQRVNTSINSLNLQPITGALRARIGGLTTAPSGNAFHGTDLAGAGKLSASLDEFRYWKVERTHEEISKNYFRHVDGGTNTDISNTELGVYFKFNEGITTNTTTDSTVLDYSGRITNGTWVGYPSSNARNTGSAIVSASAADREVEDPIIHSNHPDVTSKRSALSLSGSAYDYQNNSSIYYTMPSWIIEQEEEEGGELLNLTQIIGSYFDTLHSQISEVPKLKNISYASSSHRPYPFSGRLLESNGLFAPEIFVDATVLEQFKDQSETELYEKDITEVKNLIYQNIYNNLVYIYKSKGTEKSFRNIIRCYGVDDELIKINLYGNNVTHKLRDNFRSSITKRRFADFNHPDRFEATVTHQTSSANANTLDVTYISCSSNPSTAEIEVIFPKKFSPSDANYFSTNFLSSSIFGYHRVNTSKDLQDYSGYSAAADRSLQVYAVRTYPGSNDAYFVMENPSQSIFVTSSVYENIYDDTKWNLAIRTYLDKKESAEKVSGSSGTSGESDIILELYGVNVELGVVKNEFSITGSAAQSSTNNGYISNPRRYYFGAHRTNFTGSLINESDLKITSLRHWNTFLDNNEIISHAKNTNAHGVLRPYESAFVYDTDLEGSIIPRIETLALHWNLEDVSQSDSNGEFLVNDFSSGSIEKRDRYPGDFGQSVANQYTGRGFFFPASATGSIAVEYVQTAVQNPPEVITSYDMTNVLEFDDETFTRDSRTINHFFAIEKSMYQTISEEMLNMFSTIIGFNNLIGEPVNRYRQEYKDLRKLRSLFFENVENTPDLDKYVDFYRWIDSSLSIILRQFIPASANTSEDVRTMIESHVLERPKYHAKFPTIDLKARTPMTALEVSGKARGIFELVPEDIENWRHAHAPVSNLESENTVYWKYAEATHPVLSSSDDGVNQTRAAIIQSKVSDRARRRGTPVKISFEADSEDKISRFGTGRKIIHGGTNLPQTTRPGAFIDKYTENYGTVVTTATRESDSIKDIDDVIHPMHKKYFTYSAGNVFDGIKAQNYLPFRYLSGNLDTGYNTTFTDFQAVNIHSFESYHLGGEIPMQTPFTEKFVGGFSSRHQNISDGTDDASTRAESFYVNQSATALRFRGLDEAGQWPRATRPYSVFTRNVKVKRPVNIENLQITTGSETLGNYTNIREVVQVAGRASGDSQFVRNEGVAVSNITSSVITGIVDTEVQFLSSSAHMMTTRFSSPGGPDVAHGALDSATTQFSVYNALPYRNLLVRNPFRVLLSASSAQFGFKDGVSATEDDYSGVANYFKINRNTLNRIEYSNEFVGDLGTVATGSVRDNAFVTRPIPQSDLQYTWLTASYVSTEPGGTRASGRKMLGYAPANFEVSTSAGYVNAITFLSQSDIVSTTGIVVDTVGLNTVISEPISSSEQTLGYPLGTGMVSYLTNNFGSVSNIGNALNVILSHRGDNFGFNTWNQIRVGEHPVARNLRDTHIISTLSADKQTYSPGGRVLPAQRYGSYKQFRESPIISRYKPIVQMVGDYDIISTYGNNLSFFSSYELNERQHLSRNSSEAYNSTKRLYGEYGFAGLTYEETVYPSERNVYDNRIRQREGYEINFWHSDRDTRNDNKANKVSLGGRSLYSIWALDAKPTFTTYDVAGIKAENDATDPAGELQNFGTYTHHGTKTAITASALYSHKHYSATTSSVVAPSGIVISQTGSAAGTGGDIFGYIDIGNGNALWQTGELAGAIKNGSFVTGSSDRSNPAYNTYSDYANEIRYHGKDYSVVPEFRISDHMEYYVSTMAGDFLAENTASFDIFGATASSDFPTDSSYEQFYNVYSNSDFLRHFDIIDSDHRDVTTDREITLSCKALMKFLPYNGFYPAERTLQMATQFSSSYAQFVKVEGADSTYEQAKIRPFLEPVFAPGIVYNSVKSGIGVPYPVMTSSFEVQTLGDSYYAISGSGEALLRYIDFEAAVEPEKYLAGFQILDAAPHPSASMNLTASWNGQGDPLYRMMASNFFGECPEFFLPNGNMTTITSLPESDPGFGNAVSGTTYAMRVKMYRSMNTSRTFGSLGYEVPQDNPLQSDLRETFTMYSRPSAFYHPITGRNALAQTDHDGTLSQRMLDSHSGYNWAATPPYYHGQAWLDFAFTATETKKYRLEEILGAISAELSIRFDDNFTIGNNAGFYNPNLVAGKRPLRQNILNLDDVLITDGRARIKSVEYDPVTGQPTKISDDPTANHVAMVIQPKWETPMFNFADSPVDLESNLTMPTYGSESVPRGMWHQFGLPPDTPEKGIFLQATDIPSEWLAQHPNATTYYDGADTESLVDLLGISQDPRRLGEVAQAKEIKEAVVAIPFVQRGSSKAFFEIPDTIAQAMRAGKLPEDNSIADMYSKMQNYVFPPKFDFATNPSVRPIAMYIFEFSHTFDSDDLTHIWQNLPPKSIERVEEQQASISHKVLEDQLLNSSEVPDQLQWMVFKVKQKAVKNYFSKVASKSGDNLDDKRFKFEFEIAGKKRETEYSYNWPYDFFSMVELVKIDAKIDLIGSEQE